VLVEIGATCTLTVAIRPGAIGVRSTSIELTTPDGPLGRLPVQATGVAPAPVQASPSAVTFGSTVVGSTSPSTVVTLTNNRAKPFVLRAMKATDGSFGPAGPDTCTGVEIATGASCEVTVVHHPGSAGVATGELLLFDGSGHQITAIPVSGTGTAGTASVDPAQLDVGRWHGALVLLPVTVTNTGNGPLDLRTVDVVGDFRKRSFGCQGFFLLPGSSCDVLVELAAVTRGTFNGQLVLTSVGPSATWTFDLRGSVA
jgi:hypothetical protein